MFNKGFKFLVVFLFCFILFSSNRVLALDWNGSGGSYSGSCSYYCWEYPPGHKCDCIDIELPPVCWVGFGKCYGSSPTNLDWSARTWTCDNAVGPAVDCSNCGNWSACSATSCGTSGTQLRTCVNDDFSTYDDSRDCSAPACPDPVPPSPPTISGSCSTKNKINVSWNNPGEGTTHYQFRISEAGAPDSEVNIIKK